jgi:hypothetical protein
MKYAIPLILLVAVAGCESIQYRGTSANVRTFSEEPRFRQYYIGMDFEFTLADPPDDAGKAKDEVSSAPLFPEDPDVIPRPLPEPNIQF